MAWFEQLTNCHELGRRTTTYRLPRPYPAARSRGGESGYGFIGRSSRGLASLTLSARPSSSLPLRSAIALAASASEPISTKANPLDLFVTLSMMSWQLVTLPDCLNSSRIWLSVVFGDRLPTYSFVAMPVSSSNLRTAYNGVFTP